MKRAIVLLAALLAAGCAGDSENADPEMLIRISNARSEPLQCRMMFGHWVDRDLGVAKIGGKNWRAEGGGSAAEASMDGKNCLHLRADGSAACSWRRAVALEPGHYRLEAHAKVQSVEGGDQTREGAGLRGLRRRRRGPARGRGRGARDQRDAEYDEDFTTTLLHARAA